MIRITKIVSSLCFFTALAGCSSNGTMPPAVATGPSVSNPGVSGPKHEHPAIAPTTNCASFDGKYAMSSEIFILKQEGCSRLTWTYPPTFAFDENGNPVRDAQGSPTLTPERKVSLAIDGEIHEGRKAFFSPNGQALIVESVDGHREQYHLDTQNVCDLYNPTGTYLVRQEVSAADPDPMDSEHCHFWSRD